MLNNRVIAALITELYPYWGHFMALLSGVRSTVITGLCVMRTLDLQVRVWGFDEAAPEEERCFSLLGLQWPTGTSSDPHAW